MAKVILLFLFTLLLVNSVFLAQKLYQRDSIARVSSDISKFCRLEKEKEKCYVSKFEKIAKDNSLSYTLELLSKLQKTDQSLEYCHVVAHKISNVEVSKNPQNWVNVFENVDLNACSRGFFHGVIEGYSRFHPNFKIDQESMTDLCSKISTKTKKLVRGSDSYAICIHAMGHMLLVEKDNDLQKSSIICSNLKSHAYDCMQGIFMEEANRENLITHGIAKPFPWNRGNALEFEKICKSYFGLAGKACWGTIAHIYASISDGNYRNLYKFCNIAKEEEFVKKCYLEGAGFLAFFAASSRIPSENLKELCNPYLTNDGILKQCIGMIIEYTINSSRDYSYKLLDFCNNFTDSFKGYCYQYSKEKLTTILLPNEIQSLCKISPNKNFCERINLL